MDTLGLIVPSTLYILGNGFDIHHNIPCQYKDFKDWLIKNRPEVYAIMTRLYGNNLDSKEWWQDFENSLTDFDVEGYPKKIAQSGYHDYKHELERVYGQEVANETVNNFELEFPEDLSNHSHRVAYWASFEMRQLKEYLFSAFEEWVNSLALPPKRRCLRRIDKNATFMTFNYTRTLEDVYGIEEECIEHMHGVVGGREEFIIGHDQTAEQLAQRDLDINGYNRDPDEDQGEDYARLEIFDVLENEMKKPVNEIIQEKKVFFNNLADIKKIVILGLSYSPIDLPYLDRVFEVTGKDVEVVLGWHTLRDKANAKQYQKDTCLSNYRLYKF